MGVGAGVAVTGSNLYRFLAGVEKFFRLSSVTDKISDKTTKHNSAG